jgi:hypothetical protein
MSSDRSDELITRVIEVKSTADLKSTLKTWLPPLTKFGAYVQLFGGI